MARKKFPTCAKCPTEACNPPIKVGDVFSLKKAPAFCPMKVMPEVVEQSKLEYEIPEIKEFARKASLQEFECYETTSEGRKTRNTRIAELIQFARKCDYNRLGIAFCGGLSKEARMLTDILESNGFEVVSVRCKVGAVQKEKIGLRPDQKLSEPDQWDSMCNPITQARVMNEAQVDLAIMLGLCIGHDTLFLRYCEVPTTVLAVKDRVTGHNPLAALYLSDSYYYGWLNKKNASSGENAASPV